MRKGHLPDASFNIFHSLYSRLPQAYLPSARSALMIIECKRYFGLRFHRINSLTAAYLLTPRSHNGSFRQLFDETGHTNRMLRAPSKS